jgi:hypothetical protein
MTAHIQFNFMTQSVSAYDAYHMIRDAARQRREYQLAKAGGADPNHEIQFHIGEWETELAPVHGDPVSPVIVSAELADSGFYVEIHFKDWPVYLTVPSTSTVTLGWLERQTNSDE